MTFDRNAWRGLLIFAILLAALGLKGALLNPPPPARSAATNQFDTDRAIARLQHILGDQRPHPVDSNADDEVRARLIAELGAVGLPARIQDAQDCSGFPKSSVVSCSRVRNVIATIPGQTDGPGLLLSAHYDSTPTGPGAGDDGIGVAALLEVASVLKSSSPPRRPVTLLFNEGEEFGLNGAAAFVRRDPQARAINSLINIDGRGVAGPALMHETSDPNAAAMTAFANSAIRPYANSISTDFAKLIPNSTDVVFYKPAGWTLLNYAWLGNETRYHSPGDRIEAVNRDTLGHVGSEVLAATRTFAAARDPAQLGQGRTVFTDIAGRVFFRLPLTVAAAFLALLVAAAVILAWRSNALSKPLLVVFAITLVATAATMIVAMLANGLRPGDFWRAYPLLSYLALYALLLAIMGGFWAWLADSLGRSRMRAAAWLLILLCGAALSFALPGATIFFLLAPALALIGIALDRRSPVLGTALVIGAAVLQLLMFGELLALIEMLLIDGPLWAVTPVAALAILPFLAELEPSRLRPAVAFTAVAAVGLSGAAMVTPRSSAERPLGFSIDYFRDATRNSASWAIATKQAPLPASFHGRWSRGTLSYNGRTRWVSTAPLLETPVASAKLLASERVGAGRRIRLALSSGGADAIAIRFPASARVTAMGLPGEAVRIPETNEPQKATLRCSGRSCDGLVIEAVLGEGKTVAAELYAIRFALPPEAAALLKARPRNAIPQYAPDSTITRTDVKL